MLILILKEQPSQFHRIKLTGFDYLYTEKNEIKSKSIVIPKTHSAFLPKTPATHNAQTFLGVVPELSP